MIMIRIKSQKLRQRKPWRLWQKLLLGAYLINFLSFALVSLCYSGAATLDKHVNDEDNQTMTYLVSGYLSQPDTAFGFLMSEVGPNYTYARFENMGWDAEATAEAIVADIRENGYRARVFAISLGDHVARYLEAELGDAIEIYCINPCSTRDVLQSPYREATTILSPVVEGVCYAAGWLSTIPFIKADGGKYSLKLWVDQCYELAHDETPLGTSQTLGVVLSSEDELLQNDYLRELFGEARIVEIEATHASMLGEPEKYLEGVKRLLEP